MTFYHSFALLMISKFILQNLSKHEILVNEDLNGMTIN